MGTISNLSFSSRALVASVAGLPGIFNRGCFSNPFFVSEPYLDGSFRFRQISFKIRYVSESSGVVSESGGLVFKSFFGQGVSKV